MNKLENEVPRCRTHPDVPLRVVGTRFECPVAGCDYVYEFPKPKLTYAELEQKVNALERLVAELKEQKDDWIKLARDL